MLFRQIIKRIFENTAASFVLSKCFIIKKFFSRRLAIWKTEKKKFDLPLTLLESGKIYEKFFW